MPLLHINICNVLRGFRRVSIFNMMSHKSRGHITTSCENNNKINQFSLKKNLHFLHLFSSKTAFQAKKMIMRVKMSQKILSALPFK
jgi:hypothetical protein